MQIALSLNWRETLGLIDAKQFLDVYPVQPGPLGVLINDSNL